MEYSINPAFGADLEAIIQKFSVKTSNKPANAVNQKLRDTIENYVDIFTNNGSLNSYLTDLINQNKNTDISTSAIQPSTSTGIINHEEIMKPGSEVCEDDVTETKAKGARQIHCSECPRILLSRKNFIKHAEDEHGLSLPIVQKSFDDQRDFDKWMSYLREERNTEFVSKCGRKRLSNGMILGYLVCSKGGCGGDLNNRKKTAKSTKTCAAYLKILRNEVTGRINIEGCIEHTGHGQIVNNYDEGCISGTEEFFETKETKLKTNIMQAQQGNLSSLAKAATHSNVLNNLISMNFDAKNLILNSKPNLVKNVSSPTDVFLNILNAIKQTESNALNFTASNVLKLPKSEDSSIEEMIASSSSETLSENLNKNMTSTLNSNSNNSSYVNVDLERRKLALIDKFQVSIQKIDKNTIEGAEVAMRFFLRELNNLVNKSVQL